MRCVNLRRKFDAYLDGELPAELHQIVRGHLVACEQCREALTRHQRLRQLMADAAEHSPALPAGFTQRTTDAAKRRSAQRAAPAPWSLMHWWQTVTVPMRATAAVLLIIGLGIGGSMGWTAASSPGRPPAAAQADSIDTYQIESLGEAPEGSLASSYLTLVSATNEGGR